EGVITELTVAGKPSMGGEAAPVEVAAKKVHGRTPADKRDGKAETPVPLAPADAHIHDNDGASVSLGSTQGWLPLPAVVDRYNPKGRTGDRRFAVGDVIRVRVIDYPKDKPAILALELGPQAAVVVMDPNTREVKAIVGGYGYRPGGFDRALQAKRQ